jgi:hypothetical protein
MSTLKVTNIESPSGGGVSAKINDIGGGQLSNRNLVINGAMRVAQRSTSVAGLGNNDSGYHTGTHTFALTMAQSTDAPTGFSNSLRLDTTTAQASPNASDQLRIDYRLEAQDLQPLAYGTASAKSFTLSFWVKSNVTGNYVVWFRNQSNEASCRHLYTINSPGVWEYKTITVSGDTANAFANDNTNGLSLNWILSTGSDFTSGTGSETWVSNITSANRYVGQTANIVASTDNDWSITGVQLEVGSKSTPFEHRSYADELQRCMRYYQEYTSSTNGLGIAGAGYVETGTQTEFVFFLSTPMRTLASANITEIGDLEVRIGGSRFDVTGLTSVAFNDNFSLATTRVTNVDSSASAGTVARLRSEGVGAGFSFDAEL